MTQRSDVVGWQRCSREATRPGHNQTADFQRTRSLPAGNPKAKKEERTGWDANKKRILFSEKHPPIWTDANPTSHLPQYQGVQECTFLVELQIFATSENASFVYSGTRMHMCAFRMVPCYFRTGCKHHKTKLFEYTTTTKTIPLFFFLERSHFILYVHMYM